VEYVVDWQTLVAKDTAKTAAGAAEIGWEMLRDGFAGGGAPFFKVMSDDGQSWLFAFSSGRQGVPDMHSGPKPTGKAGRRSTSADYSVSWSTVIADAISAQDAANQGAACVDDALAGGLQNIIVVEDPTGLKTPFEVSNGKATRAGISYRER
jgi:hypothetical protein